ncbi:DnaJ [Kalmanozyma brasiliensis GHG001]|uniref:J domain-containing protein n=1 Tax=Kalmanozyma brasiliensis (strain GHG001) TaxID=1365824 RepID=V5GVL5_KALBG|nr:DnaJ [Kalmanozyma brasiliensis GHG001]EST09942.1 DnaJ [Kalmanozyma brasiliensis GHG001]
MRLPRFVLFAALLLVTLCSFASASNWDKDDHEIFELQSALTTSIGKGTTFYSLLDIPISASSSEIKRAYRRKSLEWHPDKNSGVKGAQQRFERLGLVYKILRDERKDRYDHFLRSGFPKWRRDGYFYERYRPGLGSVMVGIVLVSMLVEVGVSRLTSGQERAKVERLKMSARAVAWGPRYQALLAGLLFPAKPAVGGSKVTETERKVRVPITGFPLPAFPSSTAIQGGTVDWDVQENLARTALSAATSSDGAPIVDCLVQGEDVLLLDRFSGDWVRLDENDARPSGMLQTWPVRLVGAIVNKVTGKGEDVFNEEEEVEVEQEKETKVQKNKKGKKKTK